MWYGLFKKTIYFKFLNAVFHKFYMVYSWIFFLNEDLKKHEVYQCASTCFPHWIYAYVVLTLSFIMFQNGQTHFKNLAAFAAIFLKVVSSTLLLVCFVRLKGRTCETRKNVAINFKTSFRSWDNQILTF